MDTILLFITVVAWFGLGYAVLFWARYFFHTPTPEEQLMERMANLQGTTIYRFGAGWTSLILSVSWLVVYYLL